MTCIPRLDSSRRVAGAAVCRLVSSVDWFGGSWFARKVVVGAGALVMIHVGMKKT